MTGRILSLCEKCPNTELFLVHIFPYLVRIRENMNSVFGQFSRSVIYLEKNLRTSFHQLTTKKTNLLFEDKLKLALSIRSSTREPTRKKYMW